MNKSGVSSLVAALRRYLDTIAQGEQALAPNDSTVRDLLALSQQLNATLSRLGVADHVADATPYHAQEFRALVENSPDAISRFNRDLRCIYVNPMRTHALGTPESQLVGKRLGQGYLPPEIAARRRAAIERVLRSGQEVTLDYGLDTPHGYRHFHERFVPEFTRGGAIETVLAVARDITDQHDAQAAIARERDAADLERRRLQAVLDALPVGVLIADADGRVLQVNSEARRIWGKAPLSQNPSDYNRDYPAWRPHHGGRVPARERSLVRALVEGRVVRAEELEIKTASGELKTILNYVQPIRDASGAIIGAVAVNLDYTEQKQAHQRLQGLTNALEQRVAERTAEAQTRTEQLRALALELESAQQRERQRLAQILHDHLQQLLVAASYRVTALRMAQPASEDLAAVEHLLTESIAMTRSLSVEMDAATLLQRGTSVALSWLMAWMHDRHGILVDVHLDDDGDPERDDLRLLLFQAARELTFNVVKHAGVGRAELVNRREGDCVVLTVTDRGRGIEQRAPDTGARDGDGLGLAGLSRRLDLVGGSLQVESPPEGGTRVTVRIPAPPRRRADASSGAASLTAAS